MSNQHSKHYAISEQQQCVFPRFAKTWMRDAAGAVEWPLQQRGAPLVISLSCNGRPHALPRSPLAPCCYATAAYLLHNLVLCLVDDVSVGGTTNVVQNQHLAVGTAAGEQRAAVDGAQRCHTLGRDHEARGRDRSGPTMTGGDEAVVHMQHK